MTTAMSFDLNSINQAFLALSDQIAALAQNTDNVLMTVDPNSNQVRHGASVKITGDSTAALVKTTEPYKWAAVNVGGTALPGASVLVCGGKKMEVMMEGPAAAGDKFWPSSVSDGHFTTSQNGNPPVGIIYDATGYNGTSGLVKSWINGNFPVPPPP